MSDGGESMHRRVSLAITLVAALSSASAGLAIVACVSNDSGQPESSDAGPPGEDATLPPGPDGSSPGDSSPPGDAGHDAGSPLDGAVSCSAWMPVLEFDASAWDGAALSTAEYTGATLPGPTPQVCNSVGSVYAPLLVLNDSPCSIDLYWVDPLCEEEFHGSVPAGEGWYRDSLNTDVWRIRATGTGELLEELPPLPGPDDDAGHVPETIVHYPSGTASATSADAAAYTVVQSEHPDASICENWDAAVELDASGWDGAPSTLEDDAGTLPGPNPNVCSIVGDEPYVSLIVNNSGCPLDVYWVDYDCEETFYGTVLAGNTFLQETFATSVWRLRATGTGELLTQLPVVPEVPDGGTVANAVFRYP
jgi:hypothetical protein